MIENQKPKRFCKYCEDEITNLHISAIICGKKECKNQKSRERYNSQTKIRVCNLEFSGTEKKILCGNCEDKRIKNFRSFEQKVCCIRCKNLQYTRERKITKIPKEIIYLGICIECKKESNNFKSLSKLGDKNPNWNPNKIIKTPKSKELLKSESSERMKLNNPMFSEEVRKKVKNTLKKRILDNKIQYKKGIQHHLYLGNRELNKYVRDHLIKWSRDIKEKNNFICSICNTRGKNLHTHHIEPLRLIIEKFNPENYKGIILNIPEVYLENTIKNILEYHYNNDIGIVVCRDCHSSIDDKYRKRKTTNESSRNKN